MGGQPTPSTNRRVRESRSHPRKALPVGHGSACRWGCVGRPKSPFIVADAYPALVRVRAHSHSHAQVPSHVFPPPPPYHPFPSRPTTYPDRYRLNHASAEVARDTTRIVLVKTLPLGPGGSPAWVVASGHGARGRSRVWGELRFVYHNAPACECNAVKSQPVVSWHHSCVRYARSDTRFTEYTRNMIGGPTSNAGSCVHPMLDDRQHGIMSEQGCGWSGLGKVVHQRERGTAAAGHTACCTSSVRYSRTTNSKHSDERGKGGSGGEGRSTRARPIHRWGTATYDNEQQTEQAWSWLLVYICRVDGGSRGV